MPSRKTTKAAAAAAARMPSIPKELVDQFVTGPMSAEAVLNRPGFPGGSLV